MGYASKADAAANNKKYREANMQRLYLYLIQHPCTDCGETNPEVLEFDHLPGFEKRFEIGRAVTASTRSWTLILTEIAKCEVVCANCHRKRSNRRSGNYRFRNASIPADPMIATVA